MSAADVAAVKNALQAEKGTLPLAVLKTALLDVGFAKEQVDVLLGVVTQADGNVSCDAFVEFITSTSPIEDQLASLLGEVFSMQKRCLAGGPDVNEVAQQLKDKRLIVKKLRERGVVPSVGVTVFRQVDIDRDGFLDMDELKKLASYLPKGAELNMEDIFSKLDADSDKKVTETEWLENISKVPAFRSAIAEVLDSDTGCVITYRSPEEEMGSLLDEVKTLEMRCWDGEDVSATLPAKRAELEAMRAKGLKPCPGLLVFRQIDVDKSGSVDFRELQRMLKALPKKKPAPGIEFVSLEEVFTTLDSDGSGGIDEQEWLNNLKKLPGVKLAIESVLDPVSGIITNYRSLDDQLSKLLANIDDLKMRELTGEDVSAEMSSRQEQARKLQSSGVKPSPGVLVFRQIDVDRSGNLDREELQKMLAAVPALTPGKGLDVESFEEMVAKLYKSTEASDGSVLDEDHFLQGLQCLPGLRMAIQKAMDPVTGKIKGFQRNPRRGHSC